jgi:hypothetical protein
MYESSQMDNPLTAYPLGWSLALVRWVGFWLAVALPAVHLPLLAIAGLSAESTPLLVALWLTNVAALVVGRGHQPHGQSDSFGGASDE